MVFSGIQILIFAVISRHFSYTLIEIQTYMIHYVALIYVDVIADPYPNLHEDLINLR